MRSVCARRKINLEQLLNLGFGRWLVKEFALAGREKQRGGCRGCRATPEQRGFRESAA
jgi:hypothetical protein